MSCPSCKDSLLNNSGSIIGASRCNPMCPDSVGCADIIPSGCVTYSGVDIPIPVITTGLTLTQVIQILAATTSNSCCDPLVWHDIALNEGFLNPFGFQPPQYAQDSRGKVWLRGTITGNGQSQTNNVYATLPLLPIYNRVFPNCIGVFAGDTIPLASWLLQNGTLAVRFTTSDVADSLYICLDGLSYETN